MHDIANILNQCEFDPTTQCCVSHTLVSIKFVQLSLPKNQLFQSTGLKISMDLLYSQLHFYKRQKKKKVFFFSSQHILVGKEACRVNSDAEPWEQLRAGELLSDPKLSGLSYELKTPIGSLEPLPLSQNLIRYDFICVAL